MVAEKECCVIPQGLSGTAVRGPACTVVWEAGGETLAPTRIGRLHGKSRNVSDGASRLSGADSASLSQPAISAHEMLFVAVTLFLDDSQNLISTRKPSGTGATCSM